MCKHIRGEPPRTLAGLTRVSRGASQHLPVSLHPCLSIAIFFLAEEVSQGCILGRGMLLLSLSQPKIPMKEIFFRITGFGVFFHHYHGMVWHEHLLPALLVPSALLRDGDGDSSPQPPWDCQQGKKLTHCQLQVKQLNCVAATGVSCL